MNKHNQQQERMKINFLRHVGVNDEDQALRNSVTAALQRNKVYARNVSQKVREDFRKDWSKALRSAAKKYGNAVDDINHIKTIQSIADQITQRWKRILNGNKLRFGTSQKALNLYLKFLWLLGDIPEPPHCPVDGIILKSIGVQGAWTKSDDPDEYADWIKRIRRTALPRTPTPWELEAWNAWIKKQKRAKTAKPPPQTPDNKNKSLVAPSGRQKPIYLCQNHKRNKAVTLKEHCDSNWNLAWICRNHGVLDFKKKNAKGTSRCLIGEITSAGGSLVGKAGYSKKCAPQTHCMGGSEFQGGVPFGSVAAAVRYLKQYFKILACPNNRIETQEWVDTL